VEKIKIFIDKYKILHVAVILLLVNLTYIILIRNPQQRQLLNLYEEVKKARLALIQSENIVKELSDRLEKIKITNESIKKFYINELKNRTEGIVGLRKELAELLKQINIFKIDINYSNTPIEKYNLHEVSVILPIEGNYINIRKFINLIENSKNFMVINGISLAESKQQLKLDIKLSAYFKYYGSV
jgi:hypothetical protein